MDRWDFPGRFFPPSRPRAAKGGIRAQSARGEFGESWWAKRWIAILDGFQLGARLQRGRRYARDGQVLSIDIGKGEVSAKVQGSRPTPYKVKIKVKAIGRPAWSKVAEAVCQQAVFASKLLAGEMPQEMEDVFRGAGVSLFPERYMDLATECSCPDWSNPCKHIAAVYYLLGEEFDRDPFLIFTTRGMNRDEFLALLGESGAACSASEEESRTPETLPADPRVFWTAGTIPSDLTGEPPPNPVRAALPHRLGKFPFWRGSRLLLDTLEEAYSRAAATAAETLANTALSQVAEPSDGGAGKVHVRSRV